MVQAIYYPYGGILSQSTNQGVQKYKYNGKEFDTMHNGGTLEYAKPELGMCFYPKNAEEYTCRLSIYVVNKIIETLNK